MICIPAKQILPLQRLAAGREARIAEVSGSAEHVRRLAEFGLRDGVEIEMFRPGNPCIIRLGGCKVCLRADDALRVMVETKAD
jgi:Fe2+ transport system protein FeoA